MDSYSAGVLSHDLPTELHRLRLRERLLDPDTKAIVERLGLRPDARCLELGAGTGSIARWLAEQYAAGHVVATDTDTRFLADAAAPNLEVLRHDVVRDDFPAAGFDLVHARSLLANLPERAAVLAKMARWLAPGGWLVVEDPAIFPADSSPHPAFRRLMHAFEQAMAGSHGADLRWARGAAGALAGAGLAEVGMSVRAQYVGDGGPGEEVWRVFLAQVQPGMLDGGLLSAAEYAAGLALFDEPSSST